MDYKSSDAPPALAIINTSMGELNVHFLSSLEQLPNIIC